MFAHLANEGRFAATFDIFGWVDFFLLLSSFKAIGAFLIHIFLNVLAHLFAAIGIALFSLVFLPSEEGLESFLVV